MKQLLMGAVLVFVFTGCASWHNHGSPGDDSSHQTANDRPQENYDCGLMDPSRPVVTPWLSWGNSSLNY